MLPQKFVTDRQTDKQTNRQTDKQTNRQTDKQTNKQTDRHSQILDQLKLRIYFKVFLQRALNIYPIKLKILTDTIVHRPFRQ